MERMEHIRGKILEGEQIVLDPVDGYLACHDHKGRKTYYGYFEMPSDQLKVLNHETCYRLDPQRRPEGEHLHRDRAQQRRREIGRRVPCQRRPQEVNRGDALAASPGELPAQASRRSRPAGRRLTSAPRGDSGPCDAGSRDESRCPAH